ncbi:ABC transporter permease subunit [Streptomyces kanamyceticus]|uniref:ABC transporter permease n=1 Tax=Streptomyces kanamyceticus TaxID=1967 RepID=A0A5J6GHY1_STRKN|nr:ABC transporter permease subunit [Streptomyces kanamyceticus]QEU95590.1 ABC transporter permease [Streptomyces kanamyceticus]
MSTVTPRRASAVPVARDGFPQLLRAEWTKLRTVRRWGITLLAAVLVTVLVSLFSAVSSGSEVSNGGRGKPPTGPEGQSIVDNFPFVHRTLTGDGSVTARVGAPAGQGDSATPPWAKAGLLIKESTRPGSEYAALMLTARHGVRLQSGFSRDVAGSAVPPGTSRWLRLTRSGATVTGYESADGSHWREVGTVELAGPPRALPVGMFVASPDIQSAERSFGSMSLDQNPSRSAARFDRVALDGRAGAADWRLTDVGEPHVRMGDLDRSKGTFTLAGSGDIAPAPPQNDLAVMALDGAQLGLVLIAALGVLFITSEYRRDMIRTTFTASPRRGRVLAAKAVVIGAAAFVAGLVACVAAFLVSAPELKGGDPLPMLFADLSLTDGPALRAVIGTAAVLALVAVLALGLGALMRGTAAAIATVVVLFVLPLILLGGLPLGLAHGIQRLTPVAGFAVQNTLPRYDQVATVCLPEESCYPQGPWTGVATLALYAVLVLGAAMWRLRRRDA